MAARTDPESLLRRATTAEWSASNPLLNQGEAVLEITTLNRLKVKVGDGVTRWNSLPYWLPTNATAALALIDGAGLRVGDAQVAVALAASLTGGSGGEGGGGGDVTTEDLETAMQTVLDASADELQAAVSTLSGQINAKVNTSDLVAERAKLAGIATGATANSSDSVLRDRSTHTGEQAQSTITGLVAALAAKAAAGDLTAVSAALDALEDLVAGKEDSGVALGLVNDLRSELLGGAPSAALDTLTELGAALEDNEDAVAAITTTLAGKAPLNSPAFTGTPTGITKTHVGLGNVDNTSDEDKPVSAATQDALDALATLLDEFPELAQGSGIALSTVGGVTTVSIDSFSLAVITAAFNRAPVSVANSAVQSLTTSSTTPQNVTGLVLSLDANTVYRINGTIAYLAPIAADMSFSWSAPAGVAGFWSSGGLTTSTSGQEGSIQRGAASWATARTAGGSGTEVVAELIGIIRTGGTAGNLQLLAAQAVSDAGATSIRANSAITATKLL